jgi:hypothetical protein
MGSAPCFPGIQENDARVSVRASFYYAGAIDLPAMYLALYCVSIEIRTILVCYIHKSFRM